MSDQHHAIGKYCIFKPWSSGQFDDGQLAQARTFISGGRRTRGRLRNERTDAEQAGWDFAD